MCLRQNVVLYCEVNSVFLEWYIPEYKSEADFSFFLDPNGTKETNNGFTAILIGKFYGEFEVFTMISSIEFNIQDLNYNNTVIICGDGYSYDECNITLAGIAMI